MSPPARGPAFWMALLLAGLTAWVGCTASPSATASTPTSATPTATRAPATATPAPIFTATATARPTPVPLAVELAATLIAPYAPDPEPRQTPDGLWRIRFTTPEGQTVELQDVHDEGRSMEPQDWVENYNRGQVLFEGTAEDGTLWRIVEQNGERMLMWQQRTPLRMDAFPYWWWGGGPEGKAEIVLPGNGQLEWLTITRTDEKDEEGHTIWVNKETGEPVPLSEMGYMYVEKILPKQGQPVPTEMELPVVVLTDWQVQALEAKDGHEYVVREGKVWVDGQEVSVPETKTPAEPESLMFNSKDGQWYLGWQGIALWQVKDGGVVKYDRPVWFTSMYLVKKDRAAQFEAWKNDPRITGELDYSPLAGKFKMGGQEIPVGGIVGGVQSEFWPDAIYVFPGIVVDVYDLGLGSTDLAIVIPQPFDNVVMRYNLPFDYPTDYGWVIGQDGELAKGSPHRGPGRPLIDLVIEGKNIPVVSIFSGSGEKHMLTPLYGQEPVMSEAEAHRLWQFIEKAMLQGYLNSDTDAYLGLGQRLVIVGEEVFGK